MMELEKNARLVSQFTSKIRNLSRISELADAFVDVATSGAWRDYQFATGHFRWRASEFDYFLIANGVRRDDAARVLAYNKRAKDLAPLMDPAADKRKRRPFEQAAKEYQAADALNTDLVAAATELGWMSDTGQMTFGKSPLPRRVMPKQTWAKRAKKWSVNWSDDRTAGQAIADRLLDDPDLAREVYKRLYAEMRPARGVPSSKSKRRSTA